METQTIGARVYGDDCDGCTGPEPIDVMRFQHAIRAITGKWKIEIVCSLVAGPLRFGELGRFNGNGVEMAIRVRAHRALDWSPERR